MFFAPGGAWNHCHYVFSIHHPGIPSSKGRGGVYRKEGLGGDMSRGNKKGEQGGMTSDVQYKLHFYFRRFFQDVVFQILGERMHNNFVDVIII